MVYSDVILAEKVAAPARAGAIAPLDVFIPAGNTGMEPGKTSFFQALGVPTKIARGTIEITTDLKLVEAGVRTFVSLLAASRCYLRRVARHVICFGRLAHSLTFTGERKADSELINRPRSVRPRQPY